MKITAIHNCCNLCGSNNLEHMEGYEKHHLVTCNSCGFVFSKAIPSAEELTAYYSDDYDRTRYFSPVTEKRYDELLDTFEPFRKTNRILDVGCGYGFFLETAKKRGWEVYGTEISSLSCEKCIEKGINMHFGKLETCEFEPESFDVVVSLEVIEHLTDPRTNLKYINGALRKGGLFYLTTPNFNAYLRYRLKAQYNVIDYPNHLCYFTPVTLRLLTEKLGFETLKIKTTGISITRSKTSRGESKQQFVSETSDDEMLRYRIEKRRILRWGKQFINFWLNALGIGVSLKGWFIKN